MGIQGACRALGVLQDFAKDTKGGLQRLITGFGYIKG